MMNPNDLRKMPVKVQPYEHQKKAFAFAMRMFGVLEKGGDDCADDDNRMRLVRERVHKADDRNE